MLSRFSEEMRDYEFAITDFNSNLFNSYSILDTLQDVTMMFP